MRNTSSSFLALALSVVTSLAAAGCFVPVSESGRETHTVPTASTDAVPAGTTGRTSGSAIVIANESSQAVCRIFISSSDDSRWGPDQLGSDTLDPGDSFGVSVPPGSWDVKLTACDESDVLAVMHGVDVGAEPTVLRYE